MTNQKELTTPLLDKLGLYRNLPDIDMLDTSIPPVFLQAQKGDQRIVAIGVIHTRDPQAQNYQIIREKMREFKEQTGKNRIILNEGRRRKLHLTEEDAIVNEGEGGILTFFANENGNKIAIDSPEPPSFSESNTLLKQRFSADEIFYYYQARYIPQWHRIPRNKPPVAEYLNGFAQKYKEELIKLNPEVWKDFDFSYEHFQEIHNKIFRDIPFDPENNDFFIDQTVKYNKSGTRIQQVAQSCATERGKSLAKRVIDEWNAGKSIFLVYGMPHVLVLKPILEALGTNGPSQTK